MAIAYVPPSKLPEYEYTCTFDHMRRCEVSERWMPPDVIVPEGEGWRLCAVTAIPDAAVPTFLWTWERVVQEDNKRR